MPSLQCPECRRELLPNNFVAQGDYIVCGRCSREIYVKSGSDVKLKCPKCGDIARSKDFVLAESCCVT
jgi:predicted RNA-binding Zn-ribbon protein involved in translation (DUF1610 family)